MQDTYTDLAEEYAALRERCGLIDYTPLGLIRVGGAAAHEFLGRITTRSVDFLLEGQTAAALMLREDGSIVSEALVHCTGSEFLLEIWPAQLEAGRDHLLAAAAEQPDLSVEDVADTYRVFGLEGPRSFRLAQEFLPFPIASIGYRTFASVDWNGAAMLVSRTGVTGEYGYKLFVPAGSGDALRERLVELGAVPAGAEALDICRMEMRFVNIERESAGHPVTPVDLGVAWMADFHTEFIGREALLARLDDGTARRRLVCWVAEDATAAVPAAGTTVHIGDTEIGRITHAVRSWTLDRTIGTAWVDQDVAMSGLSFTCGTEAGAVRTVSAPFMVPRSFGVSFD